MKKNANTKASKPVKAKKAKAETQEKSADSLLVATKIDSTNVLAVEPDSSSVGDTANELQLPTPEQLGISISTGLSGAPLQVTVGDTIDFPVTVSWNVQGSAILVVPTSSANAKGLLQLGVSQESSRMVKDGKELAQITFNYKLVVQDTGNLNIPAMRFEIPTPMGQSLDLRSDSVPLRADAPVSMLPIAVGVVVALCLVITGLWRVRRRAKAQKVLEKWRDSLSAIRERMAVLKQRVMVADSREWLLELESVCKEYVALRFHVKDASTVNLDTVPEPTIQTGILGTYINEAERIIHRNLIPFVITSRAHVSS